MARRLVLDRLVCRFVFIRVTQCVLLPTDTSLNVVTTYTQALADYDATIDPGFVSLEGYLVGRMTIEALYRIPGNITRESFIASVYESGNFHLHGLGCGPFLPNSRAFYDEHGCNQCIRNVWGTQITDQGAFIEFDLANFEFSSCGYSPKVWKTLEFGLSSEANSEKELAISHGIRAAFRSLNDAGIPNRPE